MTKKICTLQNEIANGGVSSPRCSTATAPISLMPDATSHMWARFRTEPNQNKKLWICKMWEGHYMHVERGDLWNRWALWIWGCERWSVSLRSAFAIVFVVVVADWVCAERVKERERERGGEGGSISEMVFSFYFLGRSIGGRNVRAGT